MFSKDITSKLKDIHKHHGAYALKASFEDEGVTDSDLSDLVLLSGGTGLKVYVKIGGCEANRDIEKCFRLGIKGIVAPMVESSFAVSKFIDSIEQRASLFGIKKPKIFVNLETIQAANQCLNICQQHAETLDGIVVGRSDLSKSMGLQKKNVNDKEVMSVVERTLETAKSFGLTTKMGGTVSALSAPLIKNLHDKGLLDYFETRAVIYNLSKVFDIKRSIKQALEYEQMLLNRRQNFHNVKSSFFKQRVSSIEVRK